MPVNGFFYQTWFLTCIDSSWLDTDNLRKSITNKSGKLEGNNQTLLQCTHEAITQLLIFLMNIVEWMKKKKNLQATTSFCFVFTTGNTLHHYYHAIFHGLLQHAQTHSSGMRSVLKNHIRVESTSKLSFVKAQQVCIANIND